MILLSFVFAAAQAHAETVAVLPATGINVPEPILEAAADVLRTHLEETGRFQVVPDEANAELTVSLQITRLGSSAQVRLNAYSSRGTYSDSLPAASPDDLDRVLNRLARGLADGTRAKENGDVDTVTQTESLPQLKRASTHVFGVAVGLAVPMGPESEALPGLGVFWLYDASSFLADVSLSFHSKEQEGDVAVGIGAYLPLGRGDFTPYVGGGARYAHTDYGDGPGASGLQVYAALGGIAGRSSTVQIRGQLELFVDTYRQTTSDGDLLGGGLGFSIGIGF